MLAGAALAAIHPIARSEHPLGVLWRHRLSLADAAILARQGGRTEDETALRDAWYLRRETDDPGPGGRILKAWRHLAERAAMSPEDWMLDLSARFELRFDDALEDVVAVATKLAKGREAPLLRPPRSPRRACAWCRNANRWRSGSPTWCSPIA